MGDQQPPNPSAADIVANHKRFCDELMKGLGKHLNPSPDPPIWAIVELMGHRTLAGLVTEVTFHGEKLSSCQTPLPDGTFLTQLFRAANIYQLTQLEEGEVRAYIEDGLHGKRCLHLIDFDILTARPNWPKPEVTDERREEGQTRADAGHRPAEPHAGCSRDHDERSDDYYWSDPDEE